MAKAGRKGSAKKGEKKKGKREKGVDPVKIVFQDGLKVESGI